MKRFLCGSVVLGLCVTPATVWADPIIPDQSNSDFIPHLMQSIQSFRPIGQEFTPTLPFLDAVELRTQDFGSLNNGIGASLFLNIRGGTITGPLIGTSLVITLPDNFGVSSDNAGAITRFDFPSTVPLVPGQLFVMEVIVASGDNWGVGSSSGAFSTYPGGNQILMGIPQTNNDLWFVEGPVGSPTPEPSTLLLLGLGTLGVISWAWWRKASLA